MTKLPVAAILLLGGIASAAPVKKPSVSLDGPRVTGALDRRAVAAAVKRAQSKLLDCYKKELASKADLDGTVTVSLTVGADGTTTVDEATGLNAGVEACVAATLAKLKLGRPEDGEPVTVAYTFTFTPDKPAVPAGEDSIYGGLLGNEAGEMTGGFGFGRSGFGPGGGGTGWGTIGTGGIGTVGKGSGTGSGYGRRTSAVTTISIGQPKVTAGDLDKAIIRRYIKRNIQKLTYCYEKQLLIKTTLPGGTVVASFTIGVDGTVTSSAASGVDNDVTTCVADVIQAIAFPKPKGAAEVVVTYPLTIRPPDPPAKK